MHVAVEVHIGNVGGDVHQRPVGRLHDAAVDGIQRKHLVVAHNGHVGAAERAVDRVGVRAAQVGRQVALHPQVAAGVEAQRREVGPAQVQLRDFVARIVGVAQVHHRLQVQVEVGVVFAARVDDVAVAVQVHVGLDALVGVAVVGGALHVGHHLAHQRTGVLQVAGGVEPPRGRDAPDGGVLQQLARIEAAHREGARQRLLPIGPRRAQVAAEGHVAVGRVHRQVGHELQRGGPPAEGAAQGNAGRNADVVGNGALRHKALNVSPRGGEFLNVDVHQQAAIHVGKALNAAARGLEHGVAQPYHFQPAHGEVAHAPGNAPIHQHRLFRAGVKRRGISQIGGQVENVAEAQAHVAQVALYLHLGQLVHVGQRVQALVADGQRAPDARVGRDEVEAVEANLHRVVHHVGLPGGNLEAALLLAGQVVNPGRGAVFGVAQVARVQHEVGEIEVVVVEGRQAGFLPGLVEVVKLHVQPADVGLVQGHLPGQALAGGGLGLVGGLVELAHGLGGVHHALLHGHLLVLGVGEGGVFERQLVQLNQLLGQINILSRNLGLPDGGADVLRRRVVLIGKRHAVQGQPVDAELQRQRLGGLGAGHFGGGFGLLDADGGAAQRGVIHLIHRVIHIHLVHVHRHLAQLGADVGAGYLIQLREVDVGQPRLADVVLEARRSGVHRRVRVHEGIDNKIVIVHRVGLGAREADAAVVQLNLRDVDFALGQGEDVDAHAQVAHAQQGVALLVFEVHIVEVDGVAKVGAKLPDFYFRAQLILEVALGLAGHEILRRIELKRDNNPDNEQ